MVKKSKETEFKTYYKIERCNKTVQYKINKGKSIDILWVNNYSIEWIMGIKNLIYNSNRYLRINLTLDI